MDDYIRTVQSFTPTAANEPQALDIVKMRLDTSVIEHTLRVANQILRFEGYSLATRKQAGELVLEAEKTALTTKDTLEGEGKLALEEGVEGLGTLPKEAINELEYGIQTLLLEIKGKIEGRGVAAGAGGWVEFGKKVNAVRKDDDPIFELESSSLDQLSQSASSGSYDTLLSHMASLISQLKPRPSHTLSTLFSSYLSSIPHDHPSILPQLESFLLDNLLWFPAPAQSSLKWLYVEICKNKSHPPTPSLQPRQQTTTFSSDICDLIDSVVQSPPRPPAVIKDEIKRIVVKHSVKDANEVFLALRKKFGEANSLNEVNGCIAVLKAVQMSKNLNPEKLTELYNAIHRKRTPAASKKPAKEHSGDEGDASKETYLLETLLFDPEHLHIILEKVNKNAFAVVQAYMAKKSEFLKCVELFRLLGTVVKEELPGYSVHTFGSLAYGTWTKYSTVDITLFNPSVSEYVLPLNTLLSSLKMHPDLKLDPVFKSKYPVLRIKRADSYFWVNITINNIMGLEISKLMTRYCEIDPRVPELIIFVKVWAHINGISQSKLGLPSGYSWTLLVLHFLMYNGVIPCLQAKPHTPVMKENCDVWVDEEKWEVTDRRSLGHLIMMFFYHYGVAVPEMNGVMDMRTGMIHQIDPSPVLYPLIQPFEESRPLFTLHRSKDIGKKVVNCMRKSYNHLIQQSEVIRLN